MASFMMRSFTQYRPTLAVAFFLTIGSSFLAHFSFAQQATGKESPLVLSLIQKNTPKPHYGETVPKRVSGRVTSDGAGVAAVSVSDGYSVVKTNKNGRYSLEPDPRSVFIFVSKPTAYEAVGDWYKAVGSNVDFQLKPSDESEYYFIHVTDTHISDTKNSQQGLSQFVTEVNSMSPDIRFVLNSGDLVNLSKSLDHSPSVGHSWMGAYAGIMNHLKMPYYNVAGDHSDSSFRMDEFPRGDTRCGKPLFWEYLGPNLFSFEYGKIHFVSVDYANHLGKRQLNGKEYPTLELQNDQIKWMTEDMSNRSKNTFVITTSEWDLSHHCKNFEKIAATHDVRLQLVGDSHTISFNGKTVPYRIGGALAGCWWNNETDLCPDLSQRGYFIYHVQGEKIEQFYKGLGRRVEILSHRTGDPWIGETKIQAHLVQAKPGEELEYSLDGTDWKLMQTTGEPFYRRSFETVIDSKTLADGFAHLQVRSTLTKETAHLKCVSTNHQQTNKITSSGILKFSVGKWRNARKTPGGKVEVLFNHQIIGELEANKTGDYSFPVETTLLQKSNILNFRFTSNDDQMGISQLTLKYENHIYHDTFDEAVRTVKSKHWGAASSDWGAYIVGDGHLSENTFTLKRNRFTFVLE